MSEFKYDDARAKKLRKHFRTDGKNIDSITQVLLCIAEKFECRDITDIGIEVSDIMHDFKQAMSFSATDMAERGVYIKEDEDDGQTKI